MKHANLETAREIVNQFRDFRFYIRGGHVRGLSVDSFFRYLFSDHNSPLNPSVHHDMDRPLSHYFIYTGHNSYLTGNQLSSDCSDVPIINALRSGVRVIELDLWPAAKDNICVRHGRTMTVPVELIKCLTSIRQYAFYASEYPLIITLEDHLTAKLQVKVAKMIHETFGEMLYFPEKSLDELPSPEYLKKRILISTKPPKEYLEAKSNENENKNDWVRGDDSEDEGQWGTNTNSEDFEENEKKRHKHPEYKRLIAIPVKKKSVSLKEAFKIDPKNVTRLSLSEEALEKAVVLHGTEIVRFTQRNILRIYPKGTRFTSSNYNPLLGWTHGAQMVAFNLQGHGKSLRTMQGMFRCNGGCGYFKKPDILLNKDLNGLVFNYNFSLLPVKTNLKVRVIMGDGWRFDYSRTHFDNYSPPDFFTKLEMIGVAVDKMKKKTKAIEDNWAPVWDEEFIFPLRVPELALLRIKSREYDVSEKNDFSGETCIPVSELRTGIRAVPLFNNKGLKLNSVKILMEFKFLQI